MINKKNTGGEWYNEIIEAASLVDKRYPVKGMNVLPPYGFKLVSLVDGIIRSEVNSYGFQESMFPLLISRDQLSVEFEHVKGFEGQVFWVTKGGIEPLEVDLALRPTSEAAMYPMFSLWIRAHTDLPLKLYQIVTTYRYETKHTRAFIRDREIHFFEAHTAHVDLEDSEKQMAEYRQIMKSVAQKLCLPYVINRRPEWDKFPGSQYSLAFDLILPSGRSLQIGTIHQYGENFARNYEIQYSDADGERKFVNQTTYGMSGRLVAAIVFMHGDDKGLILPPAVAPIQFVIVPIPGEKKDLGSFSAKVKNQIESFGYRVHLDDREAYTPGFKYNDWEMRGVPFRVEIGAREADGNFITLVPRNTGKRKKIEVRDLQEALAKAISVLQSDLMSAAMKMMSDLTINVNDIKNAKTSTGMIRLMWCGRKECADKIEEETELSCLGYPQDDHGEGSCVVCSLPAKPAYFSRTY
ncbi:MAG: proline--tRNA ligase [Candidatus Thermoplasmatota archaeon]|nr:proline--tRNA ligase [Candidatus Thermoplasmatota archaeon]